MDLVATSHMAFLKEWFHQCKPISWAFVFMDDDYALEIASVSTVKLKMYDDIIQINKKVRHMKGWWKSHWDNYMTIGVNVQDGIVKIFKYACEKDSCHLYMLKKETLWEREAYVTLISLAEELTMMCYCKLGHMSEWCLKLLSEQKLLLRLKKASLPFC